MGAISFVSGCIWIFFLIIIAIFFDHFLLFSGWWFLGFFVLDFLIVGGFLWFYQDEAQESNRVKVHVTNNVRKVIVIFFVQILLFSGFLYGVFPFHSPGSNESVQVAFVAEDMLGDWELPRYGVYGREASGMFGLLPVYLSLFGFNNVVFVENETAFPIQQYRFEENITRFVNLSDYVQFRSVERVAASDVIDVDVLVVINRNVSFSDDELAVIWEFVRKGGGLLVLGDHTNVGGIRGPLNELLEPVDIQFRFDSALPLDERWRWETSATVFGSPNPLGGSDVRNAQISVGASLEIGSGVFPIVLGSYGFSDLGDELNPDFAYLGNYVVDTGEQVGDVVLAAGAFYGEGRVVVFGDTSSFQNSALPRSFTLVMSVFQWLGNDMTGSEFNVYLLIGLVFLVALIAVILVWKSTVFFIFSCVLILTGMIVVSSTVSSLSGTDIILGSDIVVFDTTHVERFTLDGFTEDSVSGLVLNFQRNGMFPVYLYDSIDFSMVTGSFIVFNAPTQVFSSEMVNQLRFYMHRGGVVVVAAGFSEASVVDPLLSQYGVGIDAIPLGPVPYGEEDPASFEFEPRFVNSWPVVFSLAETRSFYNFSWNEQVYHLVVFHPVGSGGLLLVGDSEFFLDRNIESVYDYWPGNIIFLKHIIDEVSGGDGR
ncbi:MAG: hypothetical protein KKC68_04865 [Candidatus Thermoplasmatota archaeon]|nr:hypothetical protein [Candidatus Thermoplasmatota archaeon]